MATGIHYARSLEQTPELRGNTRFTSYICVSDIWSGSRTSPRDRLATAKLIEILKHYNVDGELFSSKRMRRREVWSEIAMKLMEAGFQFRNKETAWEKVSQKWRNLERTYRTQILSTNGKSLDTARSYEFFDDLHELLSQKYSTDGSLVDDSRDSSVADCDEHRSVIFNEDAEYEESTPETEDPTTTIDIQSEGEVTAETGPEIPQTEDCYDTYVDNEIPHSSAVFDDKNLVYASDINLEDGLPFNPHTSGVRDPVLRLMLEMRAQERAHFREERRERLKLQREMLGFRQDLVQLLSQQHQERMDAMYALIDVIKGVDRKESRLDLGKRLDKTSLELNLPNGKGKRRHSEDESSSSQGSSRRSIR